MIVYDDHALVFEIKIGESCSRQSKSHSNRIMPYLHVPSNSDRIPIHTVSM